MLSGKRESVEALYLKLKFSSALRNARKVHTKGTEFFKGRSVYFVYNRTIRRFWTHHNGSRETKAPKFITIVYHYFIRPVLNLKIL